MRNLLVTVHTDLYTLEVCSIQARKSLKSCCLLKLLKHTQTTFHALRLQPMPPIAHDVLRLASLPSSSAFAHCDKLSLWSWAASSCMQPKWSTWSPFGRLEGYRPVCWRCQILKAGSWNRQESKFDFPGIKLLQCDFWQSTAVNPAEVSI